MPQGKKKAFRPKGQIVGNNSETEMNGSSRFLTNGTLQPKASLECFSDSSYDPRFADMPPLEDINMSCNSTNDINSGSETTLFDKYDCLPKVIVSHFPYGVSEAQLLSIFEEFNPLMCRVMINAPTPVMINASSACIYFKDERDALAAQRLDRTLYKNYVIEVKHVVSNLF